MSKRIKTRAWVFFQKDAMSLRFSYFLFLLLSFLACDKTAQKAENSFTKLAIVSEASSEEVARDQQQQDEEEHQALTFLGEFRLTEAEGLSFSVRLEQRGDSIFGSYCGYTDNRSDCGMPSQGAPDCEIRGSLIHGRADIVFKSCYMGTEGKATIVLDGRNIIWNTTEYPARTEGIYFCAAPDSATLLNEKLIFDSPLMLPSFQATSGQWLSEESREGERRLFKKTKILHQPNKADFKRSLEAGTPFRILKEEGNYDFAQIGDEIFDVPAFYIEYEFADQTMEGYIHYKDMALDHFEDNRGNLIMLGLEEEELVLKVQNPLGDIKRFSLRYKDLQERAGVYFPLVRYRIETLPEVKMGVFRFFKIALEADKHPNNLKLERLFAWNGEEIFSVMPFEPFKRPINLSVKATEGQQLQISYEIDGEKGDDSERINYYAFDGYNGFETYAPIASGIELAYAGQQNEFTFPDSLEGLKWQGVYIEEGEVKLDAVKLDIQKEDVENEIHGLLTKKLIKLNQDKEYDFLISALNTNQDSVHRATGQFEEGSLHPGEKKRILFEECDWFFTAAGNQDEYGYSRYALILEGSKNGKELRQELYYSDIREMPVEFLWIGDLDGDTKPDFILNLSEKGLTTDTRLYLSSFARAGELVGLVGSFYPNEPGC